MRGSYPSVVVFIGTKHRVQSPLERWLSMISMNRHKMESRPYEFLLQSLGFTIPEPRRQLLPVMRTPGKQFGTPKTSSNSGSKDNGPHTRRMLSPTLVTPEADSSTHSRSLRILQPCSSHTRNWLVNAQQKLEDLAIEISMDFHCQLWSLSLISIIAVLFITGPTRHPG